MASNHEPYEVPASGCGVGGLLDGGWLLGVGVVVVVVAIIPWMVRQPWEGLIAAAIMV